MMALRWWPPLLHLTLLAVVLPLAAWRLDVLSTAGTLPSSGGQTANAAPGTAADATLSADEPAESDIDLAALAARPLFSKGRQGTAAAPVAQDTAAASPPEQQLRMLGFINDGTRSTAILAIGDDLREEVVAEGDEVAGMTIRQITPDSLTLTAGGKEMTIKMFDQ
jgi:hypothetical protein